MFIILFGCGEHEKDFAPSQKINPRNINLVNIELITDIPEIQQIDFAKDTIKYLALGDSYTVGSGEVSENRWPTLLEKKLIEIGYLVHRPRIIASLGWTTGDLLREIGTNGFTHKYELVSLLIGVNNQYKGDDFEVFQKEFLELLTFCMKTAKSRSGIFVLSIPDYGVTPFGQFAEERITEEINQYNEYIEKVCMTNEINYYNITELSRKAENDMSYLASDKLHPSKKMYMEWIDLIIADPPTFFEQ